MDEPQIVTLFDGELHVAHTSDDDDCFSFHWGEGSTSLEFNRANAKLLHEALGRALGEG